MREAEGLPSVGPINLGHVIGNIEANLTRLVDKDDDRGREAYFTGVDASAWQKRSRIVAFLGLFHFLSCGDIRM